MLASQIVCLTISCHTPRIAYSISCRQFKQDSFVYNLAVLVDYLGSNITAEMNHICFLIHEGKWIVGFETDRNSSTHGRLALVDN